MLSPGISIICFHVTVHTHHLPDFPQSVLCNVSHLPLPSHFHCWASNLPRLSAKTSVIDVPPLSLTLQPSHNFLRHTSNILDIFPLPIKSHANFLTRHSNLPFPILSQPYLLGLSSTIPGLLPNQIPCHSFNEPSA